MNTDMVKTVKVVDGIMGSGKSTWGIQHMNQASLEQKFIYITPFLDEVERIQKLVTNRKFFTPTNENKKGSKLEGLKELLIRGKDIVSTHAIFQAIDEDIITLLEINGYTLILDEVMQVIDIMETKRDDIPSMIKLNLITIEQDNKISWNENMIGYDSQFNKYKTLALSNNLFLHSRKGKGGENTLLVWTFPSDIFKVFNEVYILTYLFRGQLQCYYYQMYGINTEYYSVEKVDDSYLLVDYKGSKEEDREDLKNLISIYEGNMNKIGERWNALSSTWLKDARNRDALKVLKRNTESYFRNVANTLSNENAWTTIKGKLDGDNKGKVVNLLKGKGYTKGFIPCNARATNNYSHKKSLAYLLNRFMNPMESGFFKDKGIQVNEDIWALSELLQWIWRSRIRKGESINLFIPSRRMRELLKQYLNGEI